jgi:hypothetical protein
MKSEGKKQNNKREKGRQGEQGKVNEERCEGGKGKQWNKGR